MPELAPRDVDAVLESAGMELRRAFGRETAVRAIPFGESARGEAPFAFELSGAMSADRALPAADVPRHAEPSLRVNAHEVYRALAQQADDMRRLSANTRNVLLELDPPHLGQVRARLELSGNALSLTIGVSSLFVREMLENQLPELRQALQSHGFDAGKLDVNVSAQGGGHPGRDAPDSVETARAHAARAPARERAEVRGREAAGALYI